MTPCRSSSACATAHSASRTACAEVAVEAEDIVQDLWWRLQAADRRVAQDAPAFLATAMTTRFAINLAQPARSRRETCIGPWLREPVDTDADSAWGAERGEALKLAVRPLLEKLWPSEHAVYVLRETFTYSYLDLPTRRGERQVVARAREHIDDGRRAPVGSVERRRLLHAFIAAARRGDLAALEDLLAAEVVSYSDGGELVRAPRNPLVGRARVGKFIAAVTSRNGIEATLAWIEANGQPSVLISRSGERHAPIAA
jgi:RNA polymerase sigma-70 factor, ECF subfamily